MPSKMTFASDFKKKLIKVNGKVLSSALFKEYENMTMKSRFSSKEKLERKLY